jgi:hypothetical protein
MCPTGIFFVTILGDVATAIEGHNEFITIPDILKNLLNAWMRPNKPAVPCVTHIMKFIDSMII